MRTAPRLGVKFLMDGDWGSAVGLCQGRSRSLGAGGCHAAARPRKVRFVCFSLPGKAHSAHLRAKRRPCGTVALRNAPAGAALLVLSPQSRKALRGPLFAHGRANKPAASHGHAADWARPRVDKPVLRRKCRWPLANLLFRLHAVLVPMRAYPPRFGSVTLRRLRDARLPSVSGWSSGRLAALRSPSIRSIRAAPRFVRSYAWRRRYPPAGP